MKCKRSAIVAGQKPLFDQMEQGRIKTISYDEVSTIKENMSPKEWRRIQEKAIILKESENLFTQGKN